MTGLPLVLASSPSTGRAQQPVTSVPLVFNHVTVIDVRDGRRYSNQRVVIAGNRIRAIGCVGVVQLPAGARVVDARGKYLLPGLWDMHAHVEDTRYLDSMEVQDAVYRWMYPLYIAYGVTGIREMAQRFLHGTDSVRLWQRDVLAGKRIGPRYTGPSADVTYLYYENGKHLTTAADAQHMVDSLKAAGNTFLKFHGDPDNRVVFFALMAEARKVGLPVVGHLPASVTEIEALDSGYRSVEHISQNSFCWPNFPGPPDSLAPTRCAQSAAAYRRNRAWLVPTLYVFHHSWANLRDAQLYVQLFHRFGVPLLAGSDWQLSEHEDYAHPGAALLEELSLLVGAGLTPLEALQAATLNPAKFLHATDSLGTVAPGKLADVVLLTADPLADITNVTKLWAVVANGHYFDRAALNALQAAAPPITVEAPDAQTLAVRQGRLAPVIDLGYQRGTQFVSPEGLRRDTLMTYTAPDLSQRPENAWALLGAWRIGRDGVTLPTAPGTLVLNFRARYLNLNRSMPHAPHRGPWLPQRLCIRLDGRLPREDERGGSVGPDGCANVNWLTELIHQRGPIVPHTLEIEFLDPISLNEVTFDEMWSEP